MHACMHACMHMHMYDCTCMHAMHAMQISPAAAAYASTCMHMHVYECICMHAMHISPAAAIFIDFN